MIWAQQPARVGQADPVTSKVTMLVVGDQPQHPPERVLVGADGRCQLWYRQRPGGQSLGTSSRVIAHRQCRSWPRWITSARSDGRRWVPGHVRSFWRRLGSATPPRGGPVCQADVRHLIALHPSGARQD